MRPTPCPGQGFQVVSPRAAGAMGFAEWDWCNGAICMYVYIYFTHIIYIYIYIH